MIGQRAMHNGQHFGGQMDGPGVVFVMGRPKYIAINGQNDYECAITQYNVKKGYTAARRVFAHMPRRLCSCAYCGFCGHISAAFLLSGKTIMPVPSTIYTSHEMPSKAASTASSLSLCIIDDQGEPKTQQRSTQHAI